MRSKDDFCRDEELEVPHDNHYKTLLSFVWLQACLLNLGQFLHTSRWPGSCMKVSSKSIVQSLGQSYAIILLRLELQIGLEALYTIQAVALDLAALDHLLTWHKSQLQVQNPSPIHPDLLSTGPNSCRNRSCW
jgi:hypothetical protein